ncbi:addiction module protein [Derxia lacustris]|uniref:addiction module protein n=1 Tax=Derxia lacustris TaxID=764842 RepID=UPI000A1710AE|nr:addiction module protein [Derxia lacustris]
MPTAYERLHAEALSLPEDERARLAEELMASLPADAELLAAWAAEAERRIDAEAAGEADARDYDTVLRELRAGLGRPA